MLSRQEKVLVKFRLFIHGSNKILPCSYTKDEIRQIAVGLEVFISLHPA